ncbi:MAG TPA: hypothetical protein VFC78_14375 [Tepidisphaeraceae bacterium]|nr:hypothetical protein [Tepidisphaeraceae bacterium]
MKVAANEDIANAIRHILTFNGQDFSRFAEITVLDPNKIASDGAELQPSQPLQSPFLPVSNPNSRMKTAKAPKKVVDILNGTSRAPIFGDLAG